DGGKMGARKARRLRANIRRRAGPLPPNSVPKVPHDIRISPILFKQRGLRTRVCSREEDNKMWALFYECGQVSREYPDEAAVWRVLRQAGMLDENLFYEGYEIKQVEGERESAFV